MKPQDGEKVLAGKVGGGDGHDGVRKEGREEGRKERSGDARPQPK